LAAHVCSTTGFAASGRCRMPRDVIMERHMS
jgi:hypothetical protein